MNRSVWLTALFMMMSISTFAQLKISGMPSAGGNLSDGWIPIVLSGNNYKADAGIFYNKVDSLYKKAGTDSIFTSTNGVMRFVFTSCDSCCAGSIQQVTIAQLRAASPPTSVDGFVYYIIDNYKQGFFRYEVSDATSSDDGAMILVTANNKRFKRVVQDNVINAKWFGAGDVNGDSSITSLGLTYSQAQQIFDRPMSPLVLTTYDYNHQNVNWFSLQRAINYCINSGNGRLYIPAGIYTIQKGLFVGAYYNDFVGSFEISGATTSYYSDRQTIIKLQNDHSFGIGFNRCKGVRVKNLFVKGENPLDQLSLQDVLENDNPAIWINGFRTDIASPHAGFIVDPLFDDVTENGFSSSNQYPDFTTLYTSTVKTGGSTDIIFENCRAEDFIVGFCFSPHFYPQNGEAMAVNNSWVSFCRSAISIGQSQNRSIYVNNLKAWDNIETVFDCYRFSNGHADNVEVDGVNIAGGTRYLTRLSVDYNKGLSINRMHAENLRSLGGFFGSVLPGRGILTINNSWVDFVSTDTGRGFLTHAADLIFQGANLRVTNSHLIQYNGDATPLAMWGNGTFESCHFDNILVNSYPNATPYYYSYYTTNKLTFKNCTSNEATFPYGHGDFIKTGYAAEMLTSTYVALNDMEIHMNRYYLSQYPYKRIVTENGNDLFQDHVSFQQNNNITFVSLDSVNNTGTFNLTPSIDDYKRLAVGDCLYSYDYARTNELGSCVWFLLGRIASKNNTTGDIVLSHLARKLSATTAYPIRVARVRLLVPFYIVGDITSGSNLVTNVVEESWITNFVQYVSIQSPYFPVGTYITSISGTTITLSNNAMATMEGVDVISGIWNAIEYGTSPDQYVYTCCYQAYRQGDIIYNTDFVNYPEVLKWTCTKNGITGSSKPPEFEITFRELKKILPGNTSVSVGAGRFIGNIVLNTAATTDYINIGTSPGGTDIAAAVPVTYNTDLVVAVNKYFRSNTTLYFTGLTNSLQIIIPKQ